MNSLTTELTVKNSDLRDFLKMSGPSLYEICKKLDVNLVSSPNNAKNKNIEGSEVRRILESRGYSFPKQAKTIVCGINKGGAGKTTTTFYLAQRLSSLGARVLVIDGDPQGNLTLAFNLEKYGIDIDEGTNVLIDILKGNTALQEALIPVTPLLHLLPSTPMNSQTDSYLRDKVKNLSAPMKSIFKDVISEYDYILIDTAPTFGVTNTAFFACADLVILPVNPDKFSPMSLKQTLGELNDISSAFGLTFEKKILYTKHDRRENLSADTFKMFFSSYPEMMFNTVIGVSADAKNTIVKGEYLFEKKSSIKDDFDSLTIEIMNLNSVANKKSLQ